MFNASSRRTARLAIAGMIGVFGLAAAPAAMASPIAKVRRHIHHANRALDNVPTATANGHLNATLSTLTSQLGAASDISVNMAVDAQTPNAQAAAAQALALVSSEDAKAEAVLTSEVPTVTGAEQSALVKADLEATQGQELALSALSDLKVDSSAQEAAIEGRIDALSTKAEGLLTGLVTMSTPDTAGCPSVNAFENVVASDIPASVQAQLDPVSLSLPAINGVVSADGTLLSSLVSAEASATTANVALNTGCVPSDTNGDGSVNGLGGIVSVVVSLGLSVR